jgi:hypothetical protein
VIHAREVDPRLALRLAGLVDGEGCFFIGKQPRAGYYCSFVVKMREDDRPMLERYRDALGGIGRLSRQARTNTWAPTIRWDVSKKREVGIIRDLFELYPLWSKKRRDFAIWRDAYDFWACVDGRADWTPMAEASDALVAVRKFSSLEETLADRARERAERESERA